jgi:hypothetical protein
MIILLRESKNLTNIIPPIFIQGRENGGGGMRRVLVSILVFSAKNLNASSALSCRPRNPYQGEDGANIFGTCHSDDIC